MLSIEQLKEKQAKELAQLQAEHDLLNSVPWDADRVTIDYLGERFSYKAKGIKGLLNTLEELRPYMAIMYRYRHKQGHLCYEPMDIIPEEQATFAEVPHILYVNVNGATSYGPCVDVSGWLRNPSTDKVYKFTIGVEDARGINCFPQFGPIIEFGGYNHSGERVVKRKSPNRTLDKYSIMTTEYGGGTQDHIIYYYHYADLNVFKECIEAVTGVSYE